MGGGDEFVVEVEGVFHLFLEQLFHTKLLFQQGISGNEGVGVVPASAGQSVSRHAGITVGTTMVGSEEEQVVATTDALIQHLNEVGNLAVELPIDGIDLGRVATVVVGAHVGVGDTDGEHVGHVTLPQPLVDEGLLGEGKGHGGA